MTPETIPDFQLDLVCGGTNGVTEGPNGEGCTEPHVPTVPTLPGPFEVPTLF